MAEPKVREVADGVAEVFLPLPMRPTIINVYLVRGAGRVCQGVEKFRHHQSVRDPVLISVATRPSSASP
jgi:hypothetical protein